MRRITEPEELRLALIILRGLRSWTQVELAAAAGTTPSVLSEYEGGKRLPTRKAVERVAMAVGVPPAFLDALLPALRSLILAGEVPASAAATVLQGETVIERLRDRLGPVLREAGKLVLFSLRPRQPAPPTPEDRETAWDLWARLERYGPTQRRLLVEEGAEFRNWALSERLCEASLEAAAEGGNEALELAELALRVAELVPGEDAWRSRLQGYAWAHVGNARWARGDLSGAREAFARFRRLWEAGAPADSGLLADPDFLDSGAYQEAPARISPAAAVRPTGAEKK
ncbi:MAG TPA: helix-turn-helix transcriptional regulator [Thermoanaerobaculia bacterium]|jgi:transcriptional regulator with XRE-family HTH domain